MQKHSSPDAHPPAVGIHSRSAPLPWRLTVDSVCMWESPLVPLLCTLTVYTGGACVGHPVHLDSPETVINMATTHPALQSAISLARDAERGTGGAAEPPRPSWGPIPRDPGAEGHPSAHSSEESS